MARACSIGWLAALVLLAGCGFHLRGGSSVALPESLSRLRIVVQDSRLANEPLRAALKSAIQIDPNVIITEALDAPTLFLYGERTDSQVLSVGATGKASGFTLRYDVSFRLADPKGREL